MSTHFNRCVFVRISDESLPDPYRTLLQRIVRVAYSIRKTQRWPFWSPALVFFFAVWYKRQKSHA